MYPKEKSDLMVDQSSDSDPVFQYYQLIFPLVQQSLILAKILYSFSKSKKEITIDSFLSLQCEEYSDTLWLSNTQELGSSLIQIEACTVTCLRKSREALSQAKIDLKESKWRLADQLELILIESLLIDQLLSQFDVMIHLMLKEYLHEENEILPKKEIESALSLKRMVEIMVSLLTSLQEQIIKHLDTYQKAFQSLKKPC